MWRFQPSRRSSLFLLLPCSEAFGGGGSARLEEPVSLTEGAIHKHAKEAPKEAPSVADYAATPPSQRSCRFAGEEKRVFCQSGDDIRADLVFDLGDPVA
jgi:hypothetical protein